MLTCNEKKVLLKPRKAYDLSYLSWIKSGETNNHQTIIKISKYQHIKQSFVSRLRLLWSFVSVMQWSDERWGQVYNGTWVNLHRSKHDDIGHWKMKIEDENWWKLLKFHDFDHLLSFALTTWFNSSNLAGRSGSVRCASKSLCFDDTWSTRGDTRPVWALRGPFGDPSGTLRGPFGTDSAPGAGHGMRRDLDGAFGAPGSKEFWWKSKENH